MTQDGIAETLGLARAHVALELKKLEGRGLVECGIAHITTGKTRRKVYFPTSEGVQRVLDLRAVASSAGIPYVDRDGGVRRGTVEELLPLMGPKPDRDLRMLEALYLGRPLDLRQQAPQGVQRGSGQEFIGRREELATLSGWSSDTGVHLVAVNGVAGIGKSRLVREVLGGKEVVWLRNFLGEGPRSILEELGRALDRRGRPALRNFLRGNPAQGKELEVLLSQELAGLHLVVDDLSPGQGGAALLDILLAWPAGRQVWVTSRQRLPLHRWPEMRGSGALREIHLQGLDRKAAAELLRRRGLEVGEERVAHFHRITGGNPLCLLLINPADVDRRFRTLEEFMYDEVLGSLTPEQAGALLTLTFFRRPVPLEALRDLPPEDLRDLVRRCLVLQEEDLYHPHDVVRGFLVERVSEEQRRGHLEDVLRYHRERGELVDALQAFMDLGMREQALAMVRERHEELYQGERREEVLLILQALEDGGDAHLQLLKGRLQDRLGRWDDSIKTLQGVVQDADGRPGLEARLTLGRIHSKRERLEEARGFLSKAVEMARALADPHGEAAALCGLALVSMKCRDFPSSHALLDRAEALLGEEGSPGEMGNLALDRATVYLFEDQWERALPSLEAAVELLGEGSDRLPALYNNLGYAYGRMGRLPEAHEALQHSMELAQVQGELRYLGYALCSRSELHIEEGQMGRAVEMCQRSLELSRSLGDPDLERHALRVLARMPDRLP